MSEFKLEPFSDPSFQATKDEWSSVDLEAFLLESGGIFEEVGKCLNSKHAHYQSNYFGLFEGDNQCAKAIIEIVTSGQSKGTQTKLLKVILSPTYWDVVEHHKVITNIHIQIIIKSFALSAFSGLGYSCKLYGRDNSFLEVLKNVHRLLLENQPSYLIKVEMSGRWLVIEHI